MLHRLNKNKTMEQKAKEIAMSRECLYSNNNQTGVNTCHVEHRENSMRYT